jgi:demethylmacrocin O-methyltransferase
MDTQKNIRYSSNTSDDLTSIAIKQGTDKVNGHFYTYHYETHFSKFRNEKINLLEIGVGGYDKPDKGGESLRMWKEFFKKGNIFGIDIYDKHLLEEERIKIFKGSQTDKVFLKSVARQIGPLDIVIDDGSHINSHVITSFNILFPFLKIGGIYAIEDVQTSYWTDHGGDSFNLKKNNTTMNFFKNLTDGLNYEEFDNPYYLPTDFDKHIVSIHFYHNLIFIYKGLNNEGSLAARNDPTRKKKNRWKLKYIIRLVLSKLLIRN